MGHVVTENRSGLVVAASTTPATGTAEREAAAAMIRELDGSDRATLGADKAYDTTDFVAEMRRLGVTPHVTQNDNGRRSAIDGRTTRHAGYAVGQRVRKRIEEVFGWMKMVGGQHPEDGRKAGRDDCRTAIRTPTLRFFGPTRHRGLAQKGLESSSAPLPTVCFYHLI
jgi:hypothetical protein